MIHQHQKNSVSNSCRTTNPFVELSYSSALAGAGKTYLKNREVVKQAGRFKKWIVYQSPSIKLLQQKEADIRKLADDLGMVIEIVSFYRDEESDGRSFPVTEVTEYLASVAKSDYPMGRIVLITQECWTRLRSFAARHRWRIVCDETITPFITITHHVPVSQSIFLEHLEFEGEDEYRKVTDKDGTIDQFRINEDGDEFLMLLSNLFEKITSPYWDCYMKTRKKTDGGTSDNITIQVFCILKPEIFKGYQAAHIMGALFEETLLFDMWRKGGVVWKEDFSFYDQLRFHQHDGSRLTIYQVAAFDWRQNNFKQPYSESQSYLGAVGANVRALVGGEPALVWCNNSMQPQMFSSNPTRLKLNPHGLNDYQAFNNVIFMAAQNPSPPEIAFCQFAGIDVERVRIDRSFMTAYQCCLRGGGRDPDNMAPQRWFIPDPTMVNFLAKYMLGCEIDRRQAFGWVDTPPKKKGAPTKANKLTPVQKNKRSKTKKKVTGLIKQGIANDKALDQYRRWLVEAGFREVETKGIINAALMVQVVTGAIGPGLPQC